MSGTWTVYSHDIYVCMCICISGIVLANYRKHRGFKGCSVQELNLCECNDKEGYYVKNISCIKWISTY